MWASQVTSCNCAITHSPSVTPQQLVSVWSCVGVEGEVQWVCMMGDVFDIIDVSKSANPTQLPFIFNVFYM